MRIRTAGCARRIAAEFELTERHLQCIVNEQPSGKRGPDIQQHLNCFRGLNQSDHTRQNAQHAGLIATGGQFRRRGFRIHAAEAWTFIWNEGRSLTVEPENAAVHDRLFQQHRGIIDHVGCREIIGAADDDIVVLDDLQDIRGVEVNRVGTHFHVGVDFKQRTTRGIDLWNSDRRCPVQYLSL